jgi:putative heme transporter
MADHSIESTNHEAPSHHSALRRFWPHWLPRPTIVFGALILVALVFLLIRARHDLATVVDHLTLRKIPWLGVAVAAEAVSFFCYSEVQRRLLRTGGARLRLHAMFGLAVAATGLTNLVPGGTAPASGWLVGQYRKRGIPMPLAMWAVLAGGFAATMSVLLLLVVGAAIAGLIGLWVALGCALLLALATAGAVTAAAHLEEVEHWVDRHGRLPGQVALKKVVAKVADVAQFRSGVSAGTKVLALSLGNWSLDVVCLITSFALLNEPVPWKGVLFAYAAAQVAGSLAPVPGGIGFVEGGMLGAFALTGTPPGTAFVPIIVYRLITCWGVAGIGSIAIYAMTRRDPKLADLKGKAAELSRR